MLINMLGAKEVFTMITKSRWAALAAFVVASFVVLTGQPTQAAVNRTYSFERGWSGWQVGYAGEGDWSMQISTDQAFRGARSVECYLDGTQGPGTAWMMRSYRAPMDTLVSLDLTFQLWSPSAGDVNNWEVVAYIGTQPPTSKADFEVIGYTDRVAGWQRYRFERLQLTGQEPAVVWVAFGISSTWEFSREYYMDYATVTLRP